MCEGVVTLVNIISSLGVVEATIARINLKATPSLKPSMLAIECLRQLIGLLGPVLNFLSHLSL
jgi:hypothetical protein